MFNWIKKWFVKEENERSTPVYRNELGQFCFHKPIIGYDATLTINGRDHREIIEEIEKLRAENEELKKMFERIPEVLDEYKDYSVNVIEVRKSDGWKFEYTTPLKYFVIRKILLPLLQEIEIEENQNETMYQMQRILSPFRILCK